MRSPQPGEAPVFHRTRHYAMIKKDFVSAAAAGALGAALVVAGGQYALAAEPQAVNAAPAAPSAAPLPSFADIVERVAPAVVSIDVEGKGKNRLAASHPGSDDDDDSGANGIPPELRRFFRQGPGQAQPLRATGSGFFISADGYIVTNNHVVEDADKITVRTSDGKELDAKLIGHDPATDLAVIKVQGASFPFVDFEERAKPRVGDWVVAVGNPFNLGGSATAGIVSALNRANVSGSSYVDYMQIDAPINRGNSGGPTFDLQGRVVGVNTAIFSPSGGSVGIGFDIPADVAAQVTRQLISNGQVVRGYIGATVQNVTPDIAASLGMAGQKGALVAEVVPDGPSAKAGLQPGDVVLRIDGRPVESSADLTRQVAMAKPGQDVRLDVRRDGRERQVVLRSGVRPSEEQLAANDRTPEAAAPEGAAAGGGLGLMVAPHDGGGVEVQKVKPGSDAAKKGLRAGDVIERANSRSVRSAADVTAEVADARKAGRSNVLLLISRNGQRVFIPVGIAEPESGQG
jgi:serine protease Do